MSKLEKDLAVYDVWKSVNGNLFIKLTDEHSIAIGSKGHHVPSEYDLKQSQYVKKNNVTPVKKVGRIIFDNELKKILNGKSKEIHND
jgi:hypothetical protein